MKKIVITAILSCGYVAISFCSTSREQKGSLITANLSKKESIAANLQYFDNLRVHMRSDYKAFIAQQPESIKNNYPFLYKQAWYKNLKKAPSATGPGFL